MHRYSTYLSTTEPLQDDDDRIDIADTLAVASNELMTSRRFVPHGANLYDETEPVY